jgi:vancomycin permeability regulator SanA
VSAANKLQISTEQKADVAVVFGAAVWSKNRPSSILMGRVDKAVELYKNGLVRKIYLTGSNAPGELSEAQVAFNYIKNFDVNLNDVLLEKKTTSTSEQVSFIKNELLDTLHLKKIVIVSDRYHLKRIKEIGKFFNLKLESVNSRINFNFKDMVYYKIREGIALLIFWLFAF